MNPVEEMSGLGTSPDVAQAVFELAGRSGKTAVHTRSTPGLIVNRIARPYYAETLMLLQDRAAAPELIDAVLRAAGFRMGPCELMDLIGHDTNFAVTHSVFAATFFDRRFTPSLVQQELVGVRDLFEHAAQGKRLLGARLQAPRSRVRCGILALLQHDNLHPGRSEVARERQPRRARSDDHHIRIHDSPFV